MKITYDPKIDAAYIYFRPGLGNRVSKSQPWESDEGIVFDYDEGGSLLGIEVLDFSSRAGFRKEDASKPLFEYSIPIPA